jgi:outer membrane protein assembly factor BamE (lipoprotein component of BamABCDE complex)
MGDQIRDRLRSGYFLLVFVVIGFFCVYRWVNAGHGASLSALEQVRPGMSQQAVRKVLGDPTTINKYEDFGQSWFYTRATWCMVYVYFDRDGVVERTGHDH